MTGTEAKNKGRIPRETPEEFRARNNLKLLSEVYRNHWEVFLKGFGLYMASCTALVGIAAYHTNNKQLGVFVGVALAVASLLSMFGVYTAFKFMKEMKQKVDSLCVQIKYVSFMSDRPVHITLVLSVITLSMFLTGLCQVLYSIGVLPQLP